MDSTETNPPVEQQPQPAPVNNPGSHKNKTVIWSVVAVIVVLFLGAAVFVKLSSSSTQPTPPQTAVKAMTAEVEITADGFVPQTLSVPAGTKVTWVNKDSSPHRVASNPYPENNGLPGLDSSDTPLGPDATYSYTFKNSGDFSYHDQYQPTTNGEVVVHD